MLELGQAKGAFGALEAYLDSELFRRSDAVADLYLEYGLSEAIHRGQAEAPAEPRSSPWAVARRWARSDGSTRTAIWSWR